MKTERIEAMEAKHEPVFYGTLEEALKAKSERTKQALSKLNPSARARLNTPRNGNQDDSLSNGQKQ